MKEPMKVYRNDDWPAFPLLICGGLGALGIAVSSGFAMSGLVMAAVLSVVTIGLYFWNRNRYRMLLHTIEQTLLDDVEHENREKS